MWGSTDSKDQRESRTRLDLETSYLVSASLDLEIKTPRLRDLLYIFTRFLKVLLFVEVCDWE